MLFNFIQADKTEDQNLRCKVFLKQTLFLPLFKLIFYFCSPIFRRQVVFAYLGLMFEEIRNLVLKLIFLISMKTLKTLGNQIFETDFLTYFGTLRQLFS